MVFKHVYLFVGFCQSGFVKDENDKCEPCPRGYYKDNKEGVFSLCEPCPSDKITPSTGAVSLLQCTVGQYIQNENCQ